jgi:hypothetical protein
VLHAVFEADGLDYPVFYTKVLDDGFDEIFDDFGVDFADESLVVDGSFVGELLAQNEVGCLRDEVVAGNREVACPVLLDGIRKLLFGRVCGGYAMFAGAQAASTIIVPPWGVSSSFGGSSSASPGCFFSGRVAFRGVYPLLL